MLLEKIVKTTNKKEMILEKLRESKVPLVMYGAGSYALDVMKFLDRNGITVDAISVDAKYLNTTNTPRWNGLRITPIESNYREHRNFNVIIGFSDYRIARSQLKSILGVNEIFFIDAPDSLEFFDYQYIVDHLEDFEFTYNLLQDQLSKDTFIAYINAKISGQPDGLYDLVDKEQYFTDLVPLASNEVFVDCGAYIGDTILEFVKRTKGGYRKIYAFEPDAKNYLELEQTVTKDEIKHVQLYNKGCWHSKTTLRFSPNANMTSLISGKGDFTVDVETIDNVVDSKRVTFIKMDIEGSELSALRGAETTISKSKPKLAICVYHKPEDLISIPQYINSIVPEYKFFLRHHQFISWETVLYAIPPYEK